MQGNMPHAVIRSNVEFSAWQLIGIKCGSKNLKQVFSDHHGFNVLINKAKMLIEQYPRQLQKHCIQKLHKGQC